MKKMNEFEYKTLFELYKDVSMKSAWHIRKTIKNKWNKDYDDNDLFKLTHDIQMYQIKKYGCTLSGEDYKYTKRERHKQSKNESQRKYHKKRRIL